jgi:hypothetical protein
MPAMNDGTTRVEKQIGKNNPRRFLTNAAFLMVFFILAFLFQMILLATANAKTSLFERLPVSILANSSADYSQSEHNYRIPPISENIFNQIIADFPATGSPQERMSTVRAALLSRAYDDA